MNKVENLRIYVDDIEEVFNKFDNLDISDDLAAYIENRCSRLLKNKMSIAIITKNELSDIEKDKIVDAIRSHYGLEIKYLSVDVRKIKIANFVYLLAGILIILLESLIPTFVISTVIDILGWVIIWESIFNLLFTDNELDIKIARAKKISNCEINFEIKK